MREKSSKCNCYSHLPHTGHLSATNMVLFYLTFCPQLLITQSKMSLKVIFRSSQITLLALKISHHLVSEATVLKIFVHSCKFLLKFHL